MQSDGMLAVPCIELACFGKGLELVVPDRFFVAGDMPAQIFLQKGLASFLVTEHAAKFCW